jgi:hypothetical protein
MPRSVQRLFVNGFPGLYGGAATELHHQILAWRSMDLEVHIIAGDAGYPNEPLYPEMLQLGVKIHPPGAWDVLQPGDPILGFCNGEFLNALPEIREHTRRTVFINCMTWLFDREKERMAQDMIAMFLYQNEAVRQNHKAQLQQINPASAARFLTFKPYFDTAKFPFTAQRPTSFFGCGRISRQDADKFSKNTLHIYEYFVAPVFKRGLFLGFDQRSQGKIGKPYDWIRTARDQTEVSQQEFYKHCDIILQPTDTTENWPRIGFEAMSSGSVLIVDNRGGWRQMIEHGKTGWLCNHERDFIYYASKMAYEPDLRHEIAAAARERGQLLGGLPASIASWEAVLDELSKLPE